MSVIYNCAENFPVIVQHSVNKHNPAGPTSRKLGSDCLNYSVKIITFQGIIHSFYSSLE